MFPGISTDFFGRTHTNGRIKFWVHRTKIMKALIHWVKYFICISEDPTIVDLKKVVFIQQSDTTLHRVEIINNLIEKLEKV